MILQNRYSRGVLLLTLATLIYLLWQMSLSGAILTAATAEQSRRLSDLARYTVGIGTALLTVRIGYVKGGRPVLVGLLALCLGYGATWIEDKIVNTLADRTSGQERQDAAAILLFSRGLAEGKAQMTELAPAIAHSPMKLKAFSKVLGFAVWQEPALMAELHQINERIILALFLPPVYAEVDRQYEEYVKQYNEHASKIQEIKNTLASANFAQMSQMLREQLAAYTQCGDGTCRSQKQNQVDRWLQKNDMGIAIPLEKFCRDIPGAVSYVMGRPVGTSTQRVCTVTEAELHAHAHQALHEDILSRASAKGAQLSTEQLESLFFGPGLTLEDWRRRSESVVQEKLAQARAAALLPAEAYAQGGPKAEEGRQHSIAVFLPPVALGFSVLVCVLHLTSMVIVVLGRARLCTALGALALILPVFLASSVPLSGFAGVYARWLVFWEAVFYPCGLLRPLIL